jgi:antitoxin VapB
VLALHKVRIVTTGGHQSVEIPRGFELPGQVATMSRKGGQLIIEPCQPASLLAVLATLQPIDDVMPAIPDLVPEPIEL